jgi:hypothetical protein
MKANTEGQGTAASASVREIRPTPNEDTHLEVVP